MPRGIGRLIVWEQNLLHEGLSQAGGHAYSSQLGDEQPYFRPSCQERFKHLYADEFDILTSSSKFACRTSVSTGRFSYLGRVHTPESDRATGSSCPFGLPLLAARTRRWRASHEKCRLDLVERAQVVSAKARGNAICMMRPLRSQECKRAYVVKWSVFECEAHVGHSLRNRNIECQIARRKKRKCMI